MRLVGLPAEAKTWGYDGWTVETELAAETLEELDLMRLDLLHVLSDKKSRSRLRQLKPLQVPRPESVRPKKTASKWVEWARGLAKALRRSDG